MRAQPNTPESAAAARPLDRQGAPGARHILLEEPRGELRRFISGGVQLAEGRDASWVTVTRTGKFTDPRYGEFEISRPMLEEMVKNFDAGTYGQKVFIDVAHKPADGAAGEVIKLAVEGDRLRALVAWTEFGREAVTKRGFAYLSAEYHENWRDNEKGEPHGCVLLGAGLVTRPCIKRLDPIALAESAEDAATALHPKLLAELITEIQNMKEKYLKHLREKLASLKLSEPVREQLANALAKLLDGITDEVVAKGLTENFEQTAMHLAEQLGNGAANVTLQVTGGGVSLADVQRFLAEQEDRAKQLAEKVDAKRKLFSDHLAEVGKVLSEDTRKELAEGVAELITADTPDDTIKALAEKHAKMAEKHEATRQLAAMGFQVQGRPFITVDTTNSVKALQEAADRRLGIAGRPDAERFRATGGVLQPVNRKFAEEVLAVFDQQNGARLHAEHRMLTAGDSLVSDVAVPATFERTVIREALYSLVGLQFVDVGVTAFSGSHDIPYSYRDTTAAGVGDVRVYEGGAIKRSAVKQALETAYPLPQKLAFEVSDELRYLTSNGQLVSWDAVAENSRNATRIVGEDTERIIFNEVLNASDQYATTAVVNEAVANGDGAKSIFVLNNFPVVRPKVVKNLQGAQVGATLYPVTVKSNNVAITEWDGTGTQEAGLYYWMDYNLGEIHFVDEAGVASPITNGHAIVVSYSYTTNVYKFDTDLGELQVDQKYDDFLYRFGLRKAIIEDQRFYACNFGLMSGTVQTAVEQARQFSANYARNGTDLSATGNLGVIKGVPQFKAFAPGLNMGDRRVILGERAQTRFRMAKPWTMGQLQDQKDANGRFTGKKEAYGDQFVFLHTPTQLKGAYTSIVLYSATARVDR